MRKSYAVLILFACVLLSAINAQANSYRLPVIQYEEPMLKGLKAIERGQVTAGKTLLTASPSPLGRDIATWLDLRSKRNDPFFATATQFIKSHGHWPLMGAVQQTAEETMPVSLSAQEKLRWFDSNTPVTNQGVIEYVDALLAQNQKTKAQGIIRKWWQNDLSSPEIQRSFYQKYQTYLRNDDHVQRLRLLLDSGYITAARNLSAVMPPAYQGYTNARIALSQNQGGVESALKRVDRSLRDDEGLLYDRLKWRRQKNLNEGMVEILVQQPYATQLYNPGAWWFERHVLIRRYIDDERYADAYALATDHKQKEGAPFAEAEFLAGWLALSYLKQPKSAFQHFQKLYENVETPISKARGAYWAGRAAEAGGNKKSAQDWYRLAASFQPAFYGVLANKKLSVPVRFSKQGFSQADWDKWTRDARAHAAILFYKAGMVDESLAFFLRMANDDNLSEGQYAALITMADMAGDTRSSVKVYKAAARQGYPMRGYGYPVRQFPETSNLPLALVHGIIRQESEFHPVAVSHANAYGLMQLLPGTARNTARSVRTQYNKGWLTTRPDYNVKLGSAYLNSLLERYDGALPLAAAAYNAGPGRVDAWIKLYGDPRTDYQDPLNWFEKIPFSETRNYVQRVLEGYYAYGDLIDERGQKVRVRTLVN